MNRILALIAALGAAAYAARKANADPLESPEYSVLATSEESQPGPRGDYLDAETEAFAALPDPSALGRNIVVTWNGSTIQVPVRDVGPWNIDDPYWEGSGTPRAESDRTSMFSGGYEETNSAGLDLSIAAWRQLGHPKPRQAREWVTWRWA